MTPDNTHAAMPALFISHGSPMNAIADNVHTRAWRSLGAAIGRPRAIIAVSAHWYTRGTFVTVEAMPRTIHDFGGFPQALYELSYPAPGAPELAARVLGKLAPFGAVGRSDWGLDHGAWSVLLHLYPQADIPVIQVSIDATQPWESHLAIGAALASFRDEGVLVLGSGGIVHNLGRVDWSGAQPTPAWATTFERWVIDAALAGNTAPLADPRGFSEAGRTSVPTPDHYLPLLYVLGARRGEEPVRVVHEGYELGTISLSALQVG